MVVVAWPELKAPWITGSPSLAFAAEPVATSTAPAVSATASAAEILSTKLRTIGTPSPGREVAADGPMVRPRTRAGKGAEGSRRPRATACANVPRRRSGLAEDQPYHLPEILDRLGKEVEIAALLRALHLRDSGAVDGPALLGAHVGVVLAAGLGLEVVVEGSEQRELGQLIGHRGQISTALCQLSRLDGHSFDASLQRNERGGWRGVALNQ